MQEIQGEPVKKAVILNFNVDEVELQRRFKEKVKLDPTLAAHARHMGRLRAGRIERAGKQKEAYLVAKENLKQCDIAIAKAKIVRRKLKKITSRKFSNWCRALRMHTTTKKKHTNLVGGRHRKLKRQIVARMMKDSEAEIMRQNRHAWRDFRKTL